METKTAQHAPVPWKVLTTPRKAPHGPKGLAIKSANGLIFADFHGGHGAAGDEATIEFIVRACNAYNALLDARNQFIRAVETDDAVEMDNAYQSAKKAIAKAEGA